MTLIISTIKEMQFTELKWAFDLTVNLKVEFIEKVNRNLHLNPKSWVECNWKVHMLIGIPQPRMFRSVVDL